jgi:hypothetical protein
MTNFKSDLIDVLVEKHAETEKAVLVSETGDKDDAEWLPKSQIEIEPSTKKGQFTVTMPEWLAKEKGFV